MGEEHADAGPDGLPALAFPDAAAWSAWLAAHGGESRGLWLQIAKKGSGLVTVSYAEAVVEALCHGWIDGQKGRWDERCFVQRFTPRGPSSGWSRVNRDIATRLIEEGRMAPAGLAAVERARATGAWARAYEPSSTATVPEDLQAALDADPAAGAAFAALDRQNRYAVLHRVQQAKRPDTRARRIEQFVAMLARGERLYP